MTEKTVFILPENQARVQLEFPENSELWVQKSDFQLNSFVAQKMRLDERLEDGVFYRWAIRWHCPNIYQDESLVGFSKVDVGLVPVDGQSGDREFFARDASESFADTLEHDELIPAIDLFVSKERVYHEWMGLAMNPECFGVIRWFVDFGRKVDLDVRSLLGWETECCVLLGYCPEEKTAGDKRRLPAGFDPTRRMTGVAPRKPSRVRRSQSGAPVHLRLV